MPSHICLLFHAYVSSYEAQASACFDSQILDMNHGLSLVRGIWHDLPLEDLAVKNIGCLTGFLDLEMCRTRHLPGLKSISPYR